MRDSSWYLILRAAAAIVAIVLLVVLFSLENPGVLWAVLLALLAGLAAIVAINPQRNVESSEAQPVETARPSTRRYNPSAAGPDNTTVVRTTSRALSSQQRDCPDEIMDMLLS